MRLLAQCNTVYQLLVLICIKHDFYLNEELDVLLSDIMNDSYGIADRLRTTNLFHSVYTQKTKGKKYTKFQKLLCTKKKMISSFQLDDYDILNNVYDGVLISNADFLNTNLYYYFWYKNKKCELLFYEDGLSTYSNHFKKLYCDNSRFPQKLFLRRYLLNKANVLYCFENKYFTWKPKQQIVLINKLTSLEQSVINKINFIFGYSKQVLPEDVKIIFFEEGYYGDGKNVNDIEIVKKCIEKYGSNGFYVKTHPRNRENRFINEHINSLKTESIPWELIVLNNIELIKNITLITIASGAMFNTNVLFDCHPKCVSCLEMINDKSLLFKHIPDVEKLMIEDYDNIYYYGKE